MLLKVLVILLKTEASIKIQFFIALVVTTAGFYFNISTTNGLFNYCIGLVMSIEGVNTAIEEIADFIHPEHHHKIGLIKDVAAGAVFIASIIAIIVGLYNLFSKDFLNTNIPLGYNVTNLYF